MGVATDLATHVEGLATAWSAAQAELTTPGGDDKGGVESTKRAQLASAIARRLKTAGAGFLMASPEAIHIAKAGAENMDAAGFEAAVAAFGISDEA